jgi:hypothetical protein
MGKYEEGEIDSGMTGPRTFLPCTEPLSLDSAL